MHATVGLAATTVRGLEWVAAEEIETVLADARQLALAPRQVTFTLPAAEVCAALDLRTVDDVFIRIGAVRGVGRGLGAPAQVAAALVQLDLGAALDVVRRSRVLEGQPLLDVVASLDGPRRFSRYDLEDAAGPGAGRAFGATYVSRRDGPPPATELSLRVALRDDRAEVALRLAVRPLHRRPWKVATGKATLHPPAAAALVRLTGPPAVVLDPCCGDGTIVVEAALAGAQAIGADIDAERLQHAASNARRAEVHPVLVRADATRLALRPLLDAAMVTNPPWNRTVARSGGLAGSLLPLWASAADLLDEDALLAVVVESGDGEMEACGWRPLLRQQVRLAGRAVPLALLTLGSGRLSPRAEAWRARSVASGVTTPTGF